MVTCSFTTGDLANILGGLPSPLLWYYLFQGTRLFLLIRSKSYLPLAVR